MPTLQDLAAFLSSPAGSAPAQTGGGDPGVFSGAGFVSPGGWAQALRPDSVTIDNRNSTYQPGYAEQWSAMNQAGVPGYGARQDPDGRTALAMQQPGSQAGVPIVAGGTVPDQFGRQAPAVNPMAAQMIGAQLTRQYMTPQVQRPSYAIIGDQAFTNGNFDHPALTGMHGDNQSMRAMAAQASMRGMAPQQPFNLAGNIQQMMQDPRYAAISGMSPPDLLKTITAQQQSGLDLAKTQQGMTSAQEKQYNDLFEGRSSLEALNNVVAPGQPMKSGAPAKGYTIDLPPLETTDIMGNKISKPAVAIPIGEQGIHALSQHVNTAFGANAFQDPVQASQLAQYAALHAKATAPTTTVQPVAPQVAPVGVRAHNLLTTGIPTAIRNAGGYLQNADTAMSNGTLSVLNFLHQLASGNSAPIAQPDAYSFNAAQAGPVGWGGL